MWLFVGLGNPGGDYERNRHNVGFMALDVVQKSFPSFSQYKSKFHGKISDGRFGSHKILLLKPETFMNNSGQSVARAAQFYKIEPDRIIVFHDELDIDPFTVRVKVGGGNAGHNGLKSMQSHLGTADFWRVRIGIGRPPHKSDVSNYVLGDFSKAETDHLIPVLDIVASGVDVIINDNPSAYGVLLREKLQK